MTVLGPLKGLVVIDASVSMEVPPLVGGCAEELVVATLPQTEGTAEPEEPVPLPPSPLHWSASGRRVRDSNPTLASNRVEIYLPQTHGGGADTVSDEHQGAVGAGHLQPYAAIGCDGWRGVDLVGSLG